MLDIHEAQVQLEELHERLTRLARGRLGQRPGGDEQVAIGKAMTAVRDAVDRLDTLSHVLAAARIAELLPSSGAPVDPEIAGDGVLLRRNRFDGVSAGPPEAA